MSHLNRRHGCENNCLGSLCLPGLRVILTRPVTQSQPGGAFFPCCSVGNTLRAGSLAARVLRPSICPCGPVPFLHGWTGGCSPALTACRGRPSLPHVPWRGLAGMRGSTNSKFCGIVLGGKGLGRTLVQYPPAGPLDQVAQAFT